MRLTNNFLRRILEFGKKHAPLALLRAPRATWEIASAELRRLALISWTASAILLLLGIVGDIEGWWSQRPFLTNLTSSFTGALFGIPVALLFFQHIAYSQNVSRDQKEIIQFARNLASNLLVTATKYFRTWPDSTVLAQAAYKLSAAYSQFQPNAPKGMQIIEFYTFSMGRRLKSARKYEVLTLAVEAFESFEKGGLMRSNCILVKK